MRLRITRIVAILIAWSVISGAQPPSPSASQLARGGRAISAAEATRLEERLTTNPDDLDARTRLLGYYFATSVRTAGLEATRAARRRHILWIIEHHPEAEVTTLSEITIDPSGHPLADADAYNEARQLWLAQIARHKDDPRVLSHAARFLRLSDKAAALDCLKQAVRLAPADATLATELGYTYGITILGVTMVNGNGLPTGFDPALASSQLAKASTEDLLHSSNVKVIAAAGNILAQYGVFARMATKGAIDQEALSEALLQKAERLDASDFGAARALVEIYNGRWIQAQSADERVFWAKKQLEHAEIAVERSRSSEEWHLDSMRVAARAAIEAGAVEKAGRFADDILSHVRGGDDKANGQFIHDAHVVLGRVALRANHVAEATVQLLAAGKVTGGGSLTSFGPNMTLAKELLERGERDGVIAYLVECESFWPKKPVLEEWIQTVKNGGTPNFGANLIY